MLCKWHSLCTSIAGHGFSLNNILYGFEIFVKAQIVLRHKWKFCYHLLTLMFFKTYMTFFLLQNTKRKNFEECFNCICPYNTSQWGLNQHFVWTKKHQDIYFPKCLFFCVQYNKIQYKLYLKLLSSR